MAIEKSELGKIKKVIEDRIGEKVIIKGNKGRNQFFEKEATIEATYPHVFNVKWNDTKIIDSYKYDVLLTEKEPIELDVNNNGAFDSILNSMTIN